MRKFFPGFLNRVITRLQAADINNPDLEEQMFVEDEYLKALIDRDNKIAFFEEKLNLANERLALELKIAEEKDRALNEKDQLIQNLAKLLKEQGVAPELIQQQTGLSLEQIERL
jgi:mannitol/fructose-specific phosphotransferase system IIA component